VAHDRDRDGVDDPRDRCLGTPAGTEVDAAGCRVLFDGDSTPMVLHGVTFEPGRAVLRRDSYAVLDSVAALLVANPDVRIEIAGHSDDVGAHSDNRHLSRARADAARAYLARRGVAPARLVARGYGESQPVATNDTPDGRAQNRRIELRPLPEMP
jgi:OOP family OmpA-OmpF porin